MAATFASPTLTLVRSTDVPAARSTSARAGTSSAATVSAAAELATTLRTGTVETGTARSEAHGLLGLGGLRLTRRGRIVLIALALLVALPLAGLGGRAAAGEPGQPLEVTVHTVQPGETLWGYARQITAPGQDVRDVVEHLRELNELTSGALRAGQTLLVPKA